MFQPTCYRDACPQVFCGGDDEGGLSGLERATSTAAARLLSPYTLTRVSHTNHQLQHAGGGCGQPHSPWRGTTPDMGRS